MEHIGNHRNNFCKKNANTIVFSTTNLLCLEDIVSFEPGWIFLWELKIFKIEDDFGGKRFCNLV